MRRAESTEPRGFPARIFNLFLRFRQRRNQLGLGKRLPARLLLGAALTVACKSGPPTLPPNPPTEAPLGVDLAPEHIRRGSAVGAAQGVDTDRPDGRVRGAVLRHRDAIRECYERVLPASPDAAGRVDVSFVVETSGHIFDAAAETDAPALRQTRECVLAILRPLHIDGIQHPMRVTFPLVFENPPLALTIPEMLVFPRMHVVGSDSVAAVVHAGSGSLTPDEVAALLSLHTTDHLACYVPLLRERATRRAEGSARFILSVGPDGAVGEVTLGPLDDSVRSSGECHLNLLRATQFRATGQRATLAVTIAMRPQEEPTPPPAHLR